MDYVWVKWLHVLSATLLFGTGIGSAYYLFFVSRSGDARSIALVAGYVVIADWCFTATTMLVQPLSGWYLMQRAGFALDSLWLWLSLLLYGLATACWLPVVWLQIRMRDVARAAAAAGQPPPPRYGHYLRIWTALGVPALLAFLVIFYLMVAKPIR